MPILGHAVASQKIMSVDRRLTSQWGRCDMSNPDSKNIVMLLKVLCPLITNEHIAESCTYNLLLSVTGGEMYTVVAYSMHSGVPFLKISDLLSSFLRKSLLNWRKFRRRDLKT